MSAESNKLWLGALSSLGVALALNGCGPGPSGGTARAPVMLGAAVVDVQKRADSYATVRLQVDLSDANPRQREMLAELVLAAQVMDGVFWRQSYGDRDTLLASIADPALRRLVTINYGPWDRLDGNRPLVAEVMAKPDGATFYPADISKGELASLSAAERADQYSVVRRDPQRKLFTIPYGVVFKSQLNEAATHLTRAAELSDEPAFAAYLRARAAAFVSNDYRPSDIAWMEMQDNRYDLVIGPIETYEDMLEGTRTSFEAYVLRKDLDWSARLGRFTSQLPELQRGLPVPAAYKKEQPGSNSQLNAYDVLLYAGEANSGAKTIAINLPNDEQVREQKGTRRLQLKNAMQAKFDKILLPIAAELIAAEQLPQVSFDAFFANVMFHEVAHGLGLAQTIDGKSTVRVALKELHGPLEEAKADILGLYLVGRLLQKKQLTDTTLNQHYVTFVAGILRSVRFGTADAHGTANMIEFNWFADHGAFRRDAASGRYRIDVSRARAAAESLAARIIKVQGDGDYATARQMVDREGIVRAELQSDLNRLVAKAVPVDVVFEQGLEVLGLAQAIHRPE